VGEEKRAFVSALLYRSVTLMPAQVRCVGLGDALRLHVHIVDVFHAGISGVRTQKT
jgi:hypothetical protein